jgi:hypothetical protein
VVSHIDGRADPRYLAPRGVVDKVISAAPVRDLPAGETQRAEFRPSSSSGWAGAGVTLAGLLLLFGWDYYVAASADLFPRLTTIKTNAALGMALAGIGLWASAGFDPRPLASSPASARRS